MNWGIKFIILASTIIRSLLIFSTCPKAVKTRHGMINSCHFRLWSVIAFGHLDSDLAALVAAYHPYLSIFGEDGSVFFAT